LVVVQFALGADDVFVAVDKWKNARLSRPDAPVQEIAAKAFPDAAVAMLLTTLTTAVAFFGTAVCSVAPILCFAVFVGLLVVVDYLLCKQSLTNGNLPLHPSFILSPSVLVLFQVAFWFYRHW
jgi:uncharacterized membrane protein (DUF4010 family)